MKLKFILNNIFTTLFFLLSITCLDAQKKVLGKPVAFENPALDVVIDDQGNLLKDTKEKERDIPWIVICDRIEATQTYAKPTTNSDEVTKINFKDWFYVTGEEGDWVRLATAKLSTGTKIDGKPDNLGWIEKKNLLLWTTGLTRVEYQNICRA